MLTPIIVMLMTATISTQQPERPDQDLPVSLARIRAALEQPRAPRLVLTTRKPDFRVDIRERQSLEDLFGKLDFRSGPVPPGGLYAFEQRQRLGTPWGQQPLVTVDLLAIYSMFGRAVANARRSHAEQTARDEVHRALAEFCATHYCTPH